ncbi:MAG: ribonuclease P protein component [Acidobacteria bacterium]|nr:MAG: ribonuclease P protein component [Acidobacteriota bacterium]
MKFPRRMRLLRHADFERVYQQGRRHFSAHMTVFYLRRETGEGLRVGFTVGRTLGGAVDRNRMKRRLREAVRLRRPANNCPVDVVINPKKSLLRAEFDDLLKEVGRAFEVVRQKSKT